MKRMLLMVMMICMLGGLIGCSAGGKDKETEAPTKEISRGTVDGDVYTSEFIGISFTKPELWVYSTDEEIAAAMQVGAEILDVENFSAEAAKLSSVYDMMAKDLMTGNNINVTFENLKVSGSSNITVEQYIKVFEDLMIEQAAMMNYQFGEAEKCKLGEQDFYRVPAEGNYLSIDFDQYIYIRKEGTYMIVITLSLFDGSDVATYEAMFK